MYSAIHQQAHSIVATIRTFTGRVYPAAPINCPRYVSSLGHRGRDDTRSVGRELGYSKAVVQDHLAEYQSGITILLALTSVWPVTREEPHSSLQHL